MSEECIFCKIVSGELPATIVHRDEQVVAFEDINPAAPVHLLVIPTTHVASARDLTAETLPIVGQLVGRANALARERGIADQGYRLNINSGPYGGQTVYHLHLHLLGGRFMTWPPG